MTNNFLLLNSKKTEILFIGPKNNTQNLLDHNLQLDGCPVPSSTVKNLGVLLDSNLSFENHISHVTKTAFFHLRNIAKLRNMLSFSDAEKLVHGFVTSRLDYCNALLGGCPASSINKLQIVQILRLESLPGQENMMNEHIVTDLSVLLPSQSHTHART